MLYLKERIYKRKFEYRGDFMLSEERVKLMTKMAAYEKKQGTKDFKISAYFRNDYAGLNVIGTLIWVTIGYIVVIALAGVTMLDVLLANLKFQMIVVLGGGIILGYVVTLIIYGIISSEIYKRRHDDARERVKQYSRELSALKRLYKKEKR